MKTLICLLEERSAGEMLGVLLPKLLPPDVGSKIVPFEGKGDLDGGLARKLRGWTDRNALFLVLRDQDSGDCRCVKGMLWEKILATRKSEVSCVRIACCELESFYLGQLSAVEQGLGIRGLGSRQNISKYRDPDLLRNAKEELRKLTGNRYQPISGSRSIAPYLSVEEGVNRSRSFNALLRGIRNLVQR